ncbi:hypothetical protein ABS755_07965 [Castellaniella sp. FW104-16D08]|uniref:hypothetical protein n=1 Tax=unclassified Castellaniella TaxID=2617606 RepID=UPI0033161740
MTTYLVKVRTPQAFHQFVVPNTTRDQAHAQAVACLQRSDCAAPCSIVIRPIR